MALCSGADMHFRKYYCYDIFRRFFEGQKKQQQQGVLHTPPLLVSCFLKFLCALKSSLDLLFLVRTWRNCCQFSQGLLGINVFCQHLKNFTTVERTGSNVCVYAGTPTCRVENLIISETVCLPHVPQEGTLVSSSEPVSALKKLTVCHVLTVTALPHRTDPVPLTVDARSVSKHRLSKRFGGRCCRELQGAEHLLPRSFLQQLSGWLV